MQTIRLHTFCLFLSSFASAARYDGNIWSQNTTVGAAVNTSSGRVVGKAHDVYSRVSTYLGVPFAVAPVGSLRFQPPYPYISDSTLIADQPPPSCIQIIPTINTSQAQDFVNDQLYDSPAYAHQSEDCLYLNVWTKFPYPGATLKPVMVYIFGGGFTGGSASEPSEDGAILAEEQNVVAVNFNYRLGIFGFPGAPNTRQNLAFLDQRLALEWIRQNIAAFGGDPNRIIVFGHSAGGASIDYYNFAWVHDPIIAGSIMMSGSATSFGNRYKNTSEEAWYLTSSLIGCGNATTTPASDVLTCMTSKSAIDMLNASKAIQAPFVTTILNPLAKLYEGIIGTFGPTIDNIVVFENYTLLGEQGRFIQAPILTGSNDDEGCFFAQHGAIPVEWEDLVTSIVFTCPAHFAAHARARTGVSAWQYRYFGAYPNTYAEACPGRPWHGSELLQLFDKAAKASNVSNTAMESSTGWYIRQAWAAFAHDSQEGLLSILGWPRLSSSTGTVMALGLNDTLANLEDSTVWNKDCLSRAAGAPNY